MRRLYRYVGPEAIRRRALAAPAGTRIALTADLARWLTETGQNSDAAGLIALTFVVDEQGGLAVADRHSEHIACSGGRPVLSAGELFLRASEDGPEVVEA